MFNSHFENESNWYFCCIYLHNHQMFILRQFITDTFVPFILLSFNTFYIKLFPLWHLRYHGMWEEPCHPIHSCLHEYLTHWCANSNQWCTILIGIDYSGIRNQFQNDSPFGWNWNTKKGISLNTSLLFMQCIGHPTSPPVPTHKEITQSGKGYHLIKFQNNTESKTGVM